MLPRRRNRTVPTRFFGAGLALFILAGILLVASLMASAPAAAVAYRSPVLYLIGLGIVCLVLAYALGAADPNARPAAESPTEFEPDLTDFARSTEHDDLPSSTRRPPRGSDENVQA